MTDEEVIKICEEHFKKFNGKWLTKSLPENIKEYLNNRYSDSSCLHESFYRLKNKIEVRPVCKMCGKPIKYSRNVHFRIYCSAKCQMSDPEFISYRKINIEKANLAKYGSKSPFGNTEIVNKALKTKEERYNDKYYNNHEKCRITKRERYNDEYYNNYKKSIETNLIKYGVACVLQLDYIQQAAHTEEAEKKRAESFVKTNLERYGYMYPAQVPEILQKEKNTVFERYGTYCIFTSEYGKAKSIETSYLKFNAPSFVQSTYFKDSVDWDAVNKKSIETKKKNGTLGGPHSQIEAKTYKLLLKIYPDTICQYTDDIRYPFNCDFYIPSIDTFIELQSHFTHGKHPYDPESEEDKKLIIKMEEAFGNSKTFTVRDPLKREYAKKYNLNYIEFWNLQDVRNWCKEQKEKLNLS